MTDNQFHPKTHFNNQNYQQHDFNNILEDAHLQDHQPINQNSIQNQRDFRSTHQNKSNINHPIQRKNSNSNLSAKKTDYYDLQARYFEMRQRLKNLHYFYKIRIKQEKSKTSQRNQFFMNMIEDMQNKHNQQIVNYKRLLSEISQQQKQIGLVDDRMTGITNSVNELLKKSSQLKASNNELEGMIRHKNNAIRRKQNQADELRQQLNKMRNKMEQGQRQRLKETKKNKQLLQMINMYTGQ